MFEKITPWDALGISTFFFSSTIQATVLMGATVMPDKM